MQIGLCLPTPSCISLFAWPPEEHLSIYGEVLRPICNQRCQTGRDFIWRSLQVIYQQQTCAAELVGTRDHDLYDHIGCDCIHGRQGLILVNPRGPPSIDQQASGVV